MSTEAEGERHSRRPLDRSEKRTLAMLGVPTLALALSITVVTTYLPVVAKDFLGSTTIIGLLIGLEGIMALWVPLVAGSWSDALQTPLGGRLPFLIVATPVIALSLIMMGFVASAGVMTGVVLLFFGAYFVAYEPYRALYPDLVDDEVAGRAQSTQAVWRGAGTGLALVGGGLLISAGEPVPFIVAAAVLCIAMVLFVETVRRRGVPAQEHDPEQVHGVGHIAGQLRALVRDHPALRAYLAANACWEASLGALKTFAFLYITTGLGFSKPEASGIIAIVAVVVLVAAPIAGRLSDRYGRLRLLSLVLPVYGVLILVPTFTQATYVLAPLTVVLGLGGGMIMTLPYAVLQPLMPEGHHGALTGFYSLSRGIGTALGPLLAGAAIQGLAGVLTDTKGYAAMWIIVSLAILVSLWPLHLLRRRTNGTD